MDAPDIRIDSTVIKPPFDRAAHCRNIAAKGGRTTVERYGTGHMSNIGKVGFRVTCDTHYCGVSGAARAGIRLIRRGKASF